MYIYNNNNNNNNNNNYMCVLHRNKHTHAQQACTWTPSFHLKSAARQSRSYAVDKSCAFQPVCFAFSKTYT